jgi:hypothetical protein
MEKKVCSKCKEEKEICEFQKNSHSKDGYRSECSLCSKKRKELIPKEKLLTYFKNFREKNKKRLSEKQKIYYQNNIDKERYRNKKYWEKLNKDKPIIKPKTKEELKLKRQEWIENNRELNKQKRRNKYKNDIFFKISHNVRNRVNKYLKSNNIPKRNKTFHIVGCPPEYLKEHLETQFVNGMSWNNYGRYGWHIDHIIPLSSAKTEDELYKLCHYTNLQPLWAEDNLKKSNKIL